MRHLAGTIFPSQRSVCRDNNIIYYCTLYKRCVRVNFTFMHPFSAAIINHRILSVGFRKYDSPSCTAVYIILYNTYIIIIHRALNEKYP